MIVDTSALIAILAKEPQYEAILAKVKASDFVAVGAPTLTETGIVFARRLGSDPRQEIDDLLRALDIAVIPFTAEHYRAAVRAFLRFGKGRHPAALNFGDCLSYAAASVSGEPLLYVGRYFAETDVRGA
jgi:ribonuclease VapC